MTPFHLIIQLEIHYKQQYKIYTNNQAGERDRLILGQ